jgi:hypothetical protein
MDYFQGVVTEYLRANRATFVNTERLVQFQLGDAPAKGRHCLMKKAHRRGTCLRRARFRG